MKVVSRFKMTLWFSTSNLLVIVKEERERRVTINVKVFWKLKHSVPTSEIKLAGLSGIMRSFYRCLVPVFQLVEWGTGMKTQSQAII
ncbi:hypothetical protein GYH30_054562 [Glycine max]|uniref:Uncharacterized protein n=1 Tax=Glycine max TaxID=3847 RepID=K7N0Y6_SOYBN|nr:hypothetical protein GYH30_054562 [Glycine max]